MAVALPALSYVRQALPLSPPPHTHRSPGLVASYKPLRVRLTLLRQLLPLFAHLCQMWSCPPHPSQTAPSLLPNPHLPDCLLPITSFMSVLPFSDSSLKAPWDHTANLWNQRLRSTAHGARNGSARAAGAHQASSNTCTRMRGAREAARRLPRSHSLCTCGTIAHLFASESTSSWLIRWSMMRLKNAMAMCCSGPAW